MKRKHQFRSEALTCELLEQRVLFSVTPITFGTAFPGAALNSDGLYYRTVTAETSAGAKIMTTIDQSVDGLGGSSMRVVNSDMNRFTVRANGETDGLHWLAAKPGVSTVDGKLIQAGELQNATNGATIVFPQSFATPPIVLVTLKTASLVGNSDVRVIGNPASAGFQVFVSTGGAGYHLQWVAMEPGLYVGDDFVWTAGKSNINNSTFNPVITYTDSLGPSRGGVIATINDTNNSGATRLYVQQQTSSNVTLRLMTDTSSASTEFVNYVAFVSKSDYQQELIWDYSLEPGELTVRRSGSNLVLTNSNGNTLVSSSIAAVGSLEILANNVKIDLSTGGSFEIPQGLKITGTGNIPNVVVQGNSTVRALLQSNDTGTTQLELSDGALKLPLQLVGQSSVSITGIHSIAGSGDLLIGTRSMALSSATTLNLPNFTEISGGSLSSAATIALGSGESLWANGTVNGAVSAELGSSIVVTGPLTLGLANSVNGFATRGEFYVGTATVTLHDSNQAVLGSLTSLGSANATGTVITANGALIDFGNNLVGYGTLQTPNVASKPTMINGSVEGTSIANPVTLSGFIKGVGTLNNVSISGTYSPGFSPAAVELGSVSYASSSVTVVELGGTTPGLQHDQLNHVGQALLGGTLDIELINGYQPTLGASFTILTATGGISGVFSSIDLPPLTSGLEWQISYGTQSVIATVQQINYAPTDLALSSSTIAENRPANSTVGTLSTIDANSGDTFTYSLVTGNGSTDNGAFTIVGSQLVANSSFNFESKSSYAIRVRTTDLGGLSFEKELTIAVENVLERTAPIQIGDGTTQRSVVNKLVVSFDQSIEFDAEAFQVFQRVKDSNNALVLVPVTTNVTLAATAGGMTAMLTFSGSMTRAGTNALVDGNYQLTINGGLIRILNTTKTLDADGDGNGGGLYTLGNQAADNFFALLGDANGNGEVDAQDLLGAKLALRKTIGQAGYNSAYDINGNGVVDAQDILNIQLNLRKKRVFF